MQQDEGMRRAPRGLERANATHIATRWDRGVQQWREPAIYPPIPTVVYSVSACFAVRHNGAGEHGGLVIAGALVCSRCPMSSGRTLPGRLPSGVGRWGRRNPQKAPHKAAKDP